MSLEGEPGSCLAALLFLTVFLLSLYALPSLVSNYLNLSVGIQGRSWSLNESCFLITRNGGHRKAFVPRTPPGSCSNAASAGRPSWTRCRAVLVFTSPPAPHFSPYHSLSSGHGCTCLFVCLPPFECNLPGQWFLSVSFAADF